MVYQQPFLVEQFMDEYETDIDFNLGETCCFSLSLDEIEQLSGNSPPLDKIKHSRLVYGAIKGSKELKSQVSKLYKGIELDDIVITNGAIGANFLSIYSLIDSTDHVIVVDPTYQQLKSVPTIFKGEVSLLNLKWENQWQPSIKDLQKLVKSNTKLIIINNPNNPTGQSIDNSTLAKIVEIAKQNDSYILCDEVYRPLFHNVNDPPNSIVELYEKGISTSSLSKSFSSAGLRLGWIVSKDKKFIDDCHLKRDYNTISISLIDDLLGTYILENKKFILQRNYNLCIENIEIMKSFIAKNNTKVDWIEPTSGTTCFIKLINYELNTYDLAVNLAKNFKTLVVPGEVFDKPGFLRIGFANNKQELLNGLKILESIL